MHAVLRLQPERDGAPVDTTWSRATPRMLHAGRRGGRPDRGRLRRHGHRPPARDRARPADRGRRAATLTPFSGTYLFTDPVDGALRLHLATRPAAATGSPCSAAPAPTRARGARAPRPARWCSAATAQPGRSRSRSSTPHRRASPPPSTFDEVVADRAARFADVRRRRRALARRRAPRPPSSPPTCCGRPPSRPAGFVTRPSGADVQALDGQGVELGPLLQRARPGRRRCRTLAWTSSRLPFDHQDEAGALPDSVTHSEVLYNFVKPPIHGWALQRPAPTGCPRRSTATSSARSTTGWPAGPTSGSTRAGVPGHALPHYQHGNDSGWDNATTFDADRVIETRRPRRLPRPPARRLADLADELGRAATPTGREAADRMRRAPCSDQLWTGDRFVARRRAVRPHRRPATSLLDLMPIVLGDRPARTTSARSWPIGSQDHLTDARPRHRAADLAALPGRRLLARPDLGALHRPHRGRPAPRRARPRSPTRSAPGSARCARSPASPRTSTPVPARACATAPTPGPPRLPPPRRGPRPANELTAGSRSGTRPGSYLPGSRGGRCGAGWRSGLRGAARGPSVTLSVGIHSAGGCRSPTVGPPLR